MTLDEIVSTFQTTPFLFVGSGITRRYYGLPNWEGLLKEFVSRMSDDPFAFSSYISRAREFESTAGELPTAAEMIEYDVSNKLNLIACLTEGETDADKLEAIIIQLLKSDPNILQEKNPAKYGSGIGTNLRRVIRLFDYLKYGKRESKTM